MLSSLNRSRRRSLPAIIPAVQADHLTYLGNDALADLYERMEEIEERGLDGIVIEAGCALGGSAIVIATAKSPSRPFYIYDVFGIIPPPSNRDGPDVHQRYQAILSGHSEGIGGNKYYGYESSLLQKVRDNFDRHGVCLEERNTHLVRGLFQDTLQGGQPVALAHIDGDWYDSVMTCLTRLAPRLVRGGFIVIDDYDDWSGCRRAVDEYFADKRADFCFVQRSRLQIVRTEK
jgi:asparagine synthase (glutamine-hydrolysing)